uniref:t-SNARE coiled-coil homology domain-containing protein n=1 Tax=Cynoglossus semilaevis TaxID=244447 RepID=A0A3P8UPK9_CYNSE
MLVRPVKEQAMKATKDFLHLHSNPVPQPTPPPSPPPATLENSAQQVAALPHVYAAVCVCVKCVLSVCLGSLPQSQQEKIDSIEDNVNTAAANVEEGTRSLGKVCVCLRVCVGGCVRACMCMLGEPPAGVAAALGGGALGFAGGNLVQKRRKAQVDLQMKQLSLPPPENPPQSSKDK